MKRLIPLVLLLIFVSSQSFCVTGNISVEGLLDVTGNETVSGHTTSDALSLRTGAVLKQTTANYTLTWANPGAARTLTIADPGVNDTFTTNAATQTVTNKTMSTNSKWNGNTVEAIYGGTGQTTYTTGEILYASTINTLSKLSAGTSGQSLHTQGAGIIPVWANGGMVSKQIITTNINYVVPSGVTSILVEGVAAGGGGGGVSANAGGAGGGGGAGGYFRVFINNVVSGTAYAVTVGAGGAGNSGAAGSPGTANTTFAGPLTYTAYPGQGGAYILGSVAAKTTAGGAGGAVSTLADINSGGAPGINGSTGAAAVNSASGGGGSGPFGTGGAGRNSNGANNATGYGAGGGGACAITAAAAAGGSGTGGAVFVWEFH